MLMEMIRGEEIPFREKGFRVNEEGGLPQ